MTKEQQEMVIWAIHDFDEAIKAVGLKKVLKDMKNNYPFLYKNIANSFQHKHIPAVLVKSEESYGEND